MFSVICSFAAFSGNLPRFAASCGSRVGYDYAFDYAFVSSFFGRESERNHFGYAGLMHWEVGRYTHNPEYFSAEAVNDEFGGEGQIYVSVFYGPQSEQRAKEFADWQNALIAWKRQKP